jgi:hypothetical protein
MEQSMADESGSNPSRAPWRGIWKIARDEPAETPSDQRLIWYATFVCHADDTVSVHLLGNSTLPGWPEDGVFRLATSWQDDTLFVQMPGSDKTRFATFIDDRFVMEGDHVRRLYRRASPEELIPTERPLLDSKRAITR